MAESVINIWQKEISRHMLEHAAFGIGTLFL
ncbi:hypothetical protein IMSAG025_02098 [Muribaculaceae bacterium]|nr:hypothetical protein IMSAG025_02098 [Muribaculaceae bacterium]